MAFIVKRDAIVVPAGIPLSTTNINITYSGMTRTLLRNTDIFWYNDRYGPNDPGDCEVIRYSLAYQNSQWEFYIRQDYIDEGCNTGDLILTSINAGASSSIPVSNWSQAITITAA
jgi:hypothetical protein